MRILDEGDLSGIRYTVFKNNEKLSVKFELGQCELHMKFRSGEMRSVGELKSGWNAQFADKIKAQLVKLNNTRASLLPQEDEYFPEIF